VVLGCAVPIDSSRLGMKLDLRCSADRKAAATVASNDARLNSDCLLIAAPALGRGRSGDLLAAPSAMGVMTASLGISGCPSCPKPLDHKVGS
jgi:hypothetical protein